MNNTILIVDDEEGIREIVRELVSDISPNIIEAADGKEAVEKIEQSTPSLIISDYNMPGMDGLELLKHVRELKIAAPVIWITGRGSTELYREAWRFGVYDYFEKPIDFSPFREAVKGALSVHEGVAPVNRPNFMTRLHFTEVSVLVEHGLLKDFKTDCLKAGISINTAINKMIEEHLIKKR